MLENDYMNYTQNYTLCTFCVVGFQTTWDDLGTDTTIRSTTLTNILQLLFFFSWPRRSSLVHMESRGRSRWGASMIPRCVRTLSAAVGLLSALGRVPMVQCLTLDVLDGQTECIIVVAKSGDVINGNFEVCGVCRLHSASLSSVLGVCA